MHSSNLLLQNSETNLLCSYTTTHCSVELTTASSAEIGVQPGNPNRRDQRSLRGGQPKPPGDSFCHPGEKPQERGGPFHRPHRAMSTRSAPPRPRPALRRCPRPAHPLPSRLEEWAQRGVTRAPGQRPPLPPPRQPLPTATCAPARTGLWPPATRARAEGPS